MQLTLFLFLFGYTDVVDVVGSDIAVVAVTVVPHHAVLDPDVDGFLSPKHHPHSRIRWW